jgi:hypothetical protein
LPFLPAHCVRGSLVVLEKRLAPLTILVNAKYLFEAAIVVAVLDYNFSYVAPCRCG